MNDQHPHAGYAAHDGYSTGSFDSDPLFGALPGTSPVGTVTYDVDQSGQYDSAQWNAGYDPYATHAPQAPQVQYEAHDPYAAQPQASQQSYDTTGQWDANAWNEANQAASYGYDPTDQAVQADQWAAPVADTGAYDATAWNSGAPATQPDAPAAFQADAPYYGDTATYESYESAAYEPAAYEPAAYEPAAYEPEVEHQHEPEYEQPGIAESDYAQPEFAQPEYERSEYEQPAYGGEHEYDTPAPEPEQVSESDLESAPGYPEHSEHGDDLVGAATVTPRPVRRAAGGSRGRRRTPAKRSALLTVAVPSACVMGVAGIAAASVGQMGTAEETKDDSTALTASDAAAIKPVAVNNKLDTQLAALDADARDFGDRASRTQERIDLKERQAAEKKKRDALAAAREAARPKFAIPVANHALSAYYGQAGVNWMSMHTGIDFPVSYGTPVMAATDGTVRTQWNSAYGNMAIVTAADGTETWYCHLSSTKIRSGSVKAGDEIAYSGNSGNSTGPHLHFEVRPGGGSAIDPLPWLRSHGLKI